MRLRFTIRDLLWLTIVVALAMAWWLDHRRVESAMRDSQMEAANLRDKLKKNEIFLNGQPTFHTVPFKDDTPHR